MENWLLMLIGIVGLVILLTALYFIIFVGIRNLIAKHKLEATIQLIKESLAFDFGNDYNVLENTIQDKPLNSTKRIAIRLSVEASKHLHEALNQRSLGSNVSLSLDRKTKYVEIWERKNSCIKLHYSAMRLNSNLMDRFLFIKRIEFYSDEHMIVYHTVQY